MIYIVTGVLLIFCIAVIIFSVRIYKENRRLGPQKNKSLDEEEDLWVS